MSPLQIFMLTLCIVYNGSSDSSEIYLVALSRGILDASFERPIFKLKMMLVSPCCIVSFKSYTIITYHWPVSCYRIVIILIF